MINNELCIVDAQGYVLQTLWYDGGGASYYDSETGMSLTLQEVFENTKIELETASITVNGMLYALSPVGRVE